MSGISQTKFNGFIFMEGLKKMQILDDTFPLIGMTRLCIFGTASIVKSYSEHR